MRCAYCALRTLSHFVLGLAPFRARALLRLGPRSRRCSKLSNEGRELFGNLLCDRVIFAPEPFSDREEPPCSVQWRVRASVGHGRLRSTPALVNAVALTRFPGFHWVPRRRAEPVPLTSHQIVAPQGEMRRERLALFPGYLRQRDFQF